MSSTRELADENQTRWQSIISLANTLKARATQRRLAPDAPQPTLSAVISTLIMVFKPKDNAAADDTAGQSGDTP